MNPVPRVQDSDKKVVVQFGWGEATDELAREDARPTENANCATTDKKYSRQRARRAGQKSLHEE